MSKVPSKSPKAAKGPEVLAYFSLAEIVKDFDLASAKIEVELRKGGEITPADLARGIVFRAVKSGFKQAQ